MKQPLAASDPQRHWEIDFCTVANLSPDAPDKQRNGLEVFSVIDRGSSANLGSLASAHYDAEQALLAMAAVLQKHGVPRCISYDRDPRFVGSQSTDGFPSAFTRFLLCIGCAADMLPPRRPDLKPFVERFQRTLKEECLSKHQPETAAAANECLPPYCRWYNQERPH
jgi:transposase InsO family protein